MQADHDPTRDPLTPYWREKVERACREHPINFDGPSRPVVPMTATEREVLRRYRDGEQLLAIADAMGFTVDWTRALRKRALEKARLGEE